MSYYYPQCAVEFRILPEDFKLLSDATLQATQKIIVQARDVTISVNDYKTSDTFRMEIDYRNFPFDPRMIRACGVVIYLQDMKSLYRADGSQNKIVPNAPTDIDSTVTNSVFIGFADEEEIEFDDTMRTVRLSGRDVTALLIDQKYQTNSPIALTQRLDEAIISLLATFKATAQIAVLNKSGGELPTLAKYYPDFGSPMAGHKNVGQHESYWEIIQDLVARAGLICYMSRTVDNLGLRPALVLTTPKNQLLPRGVSETSDDIKIIYGVNVKNLKIKRKLGRFKGFNIQVRSRVEKEIITAKIPEEATIEWGKGFGFNANPQVSAGESLNFDPVQIPVLKPDGSVDTSQTHVAPYITFPVPNISDKDQLIQIGQTIYEQYSLQQLEGNFDTFEMLGRGSTRTDDPTNKKSNKVYDLTQIRKGQTICIEIDTDDLNKISRLSSQSQRTDYLITRNYDPKIAAIFAKTLGKFSPRFQIKSYHMTLNQTSGFKLSIDFQNIVDTTFKGLS